MQNINFYKAYKKQSAKKYIWQLAVVLVLGSLVLSQLAGPLKVIGQEGYDYYEPYDSSYGSDYYEPYDSGNYEPYGSDYYEPYDPYASASYEPYDPYATDYYEPYEPDYYDPYEPDYYEPYDSDYYDPYESDYYEPYDPSESYNPYESDYYEPYEPDYYDPYDPSESYDPYESDYYDPYNDSDDLAYYDPYESDYEPSDPYEPDYYDSYDPYESDYYEPNESDYSFDPYYDNDYSTPDYFDYNYPQYDFDYSNDYGFSREPIVFEDIEIINENIIENITNIDIVENIEIDERQQVQPIIPIVIQQPPIVINPQVQVADLVIQKEVRNLTTGSGFSGSVDALVGDEVRFKIEIKNTGNVALHNVRVADQLDPRLSFISGTLSISSGQSGSLSSSGINLGSLSAGQSIAIIFDAKVIGGQGQTLINAAFVRADEVGERQDSAQVRVLRQNPDLQINKEVRNITTGSGFSNNVNAIIGDQVRFKIEIQNTGDATLHNVRVRDDLDNHLSLVSGSLTISSGSSGSLSQSGINLGSLAVGQKITIIFDAIVNSGENQVLTNTAFAKADEVNEKQDSAQVFVQPVIKNFNLAIDKTVKNLTTGSGFANSADALIGDEVRFKIEIQNTGDATLHNVKVRDELDSRLSLISGSLTISNGSSGSLGSSGINIGSLLIGEHVTIIFDAQVVSGSNQILSNIAFAQADEVQEKNDIAKVFVGQVIVKNPNLAIDKNVRNLTTGSGFSNSVSGLIGDEVRFKIDIGNTGETTLHNVRVIDDLDSRLSLISGSLSISNGGSGALGSGGINLGTLLVGDIVTITFDARVVSGSGQTLQNIAVTKADEVGERSDNANVNVGVQPVIIGDLAIAKLVRNITAGQSSLLSSTDAISNDRLLFSIEVKASSASSLSNVIVRDDLPAGLNYVAGSTSVNNSFVSDGLVSSNGINIGGLLAGQSKLIQFEARVGNFSSNQTLTNFARVIADNVPERNAAAQVRILAQQPQPQPQPQPQQLVLRKIVENLSFPNGTPTDNSALIGETLRYSLGFQNTGNAALANVQILDVLPSNTSFVSAANSGTFNSSTNAITWNIGNMAVGATVTVSYQVKVTQAPAGTVIVNSALLRAQGIPDVISNETRTKIVAQQVPPGPPVKAVTGANSLAQTFAVSALVSLSFLSLLYFGLKNTEALRMLKLKLAVLRIRMREGL